MALFGFDCPIGKSADECIRRREIFNIIKPYVFSNENIEYVKQATPQMLDLWLESFAMSQKGMLFTSLQKVVKDVFRKYFPSFSFLPATALANRVGLPPGTSILDRSKARILQCIVM